MVRASDMGRGTHASERERESASECDSNKKLEITCNPSVLHHRNRVAMRWVCSRQNMHRTLVVVVADYNGVDDDENDTINYTTISWDHEH